MLLPLVATVGEEHKITFWKEQCPLYGKRKRGEPHSSNYVQNAFVLRERHVYRNEFLAVVPVSVWKINVISARS